MATSIEASGHTVDEAIQIALNQLGVGRDKVEIDILHHPRRGLLGIGARRAKVRATLRESVMRDGEEFDMSGGMALDDKPRRRRRRGGRGRREDGGPEGAAPVAGEAAPEGDRRRDGRGDGRGGRGEPRQERSGGRQGQDGRGPQGGGPDQRDRGQRGGDVRGGQDQRRGRDQRGGQDPRGGQQENRGGQQDQRGGGQDSRRNNDQRGNDQRGQAQEGRGGRGQDRRDRRDRQPRPEGEGQGQRPPRAEGAPGWEGRPNEPGFRHDGSASEGHRRSQVEEEAPPADAATLEAIRSRAEALAVELMARMGFAAEVSAVVDEAAGEVFVSIRSESEGLLIGRRGQTLDSIEHILNRMAMQGETYVEGRVQVDIGDYRGRRRQTLEELAGRLRARAVSEGRSVQVSPMSPRDRKIFSLVLAGDEAVEVRVLGAGFYRRVLVAPAGMGAAAAAAAEAAGDGVEDETLDTDSSGAGAPATS